jgi:hypothetical protein
MNLLMETTLSPEEAQKALILQLIQADLKHNQLIGGLQSIHLETDMYFLGLHRPVAQLMGIDGEIPEQWFAIYDRYLEGAHKHPVTSEADSLLPVAEECYNMLYACANIRNHLTRRTDG